jgi:hypothetical protein
VAFVLHAGAKLLSNLCGHRIRPDARQRTASIIIEPATAEKPQYGLWFEARAKTTKK